MVRLVFALFTLAALSSSTRAAEPKLSPEDARYLDKLITDFLFDPTGAERVTGEFSDPDGRGETWTRNGWLVRGRGGEGHRVFFTDGESVPAHSELTGVDFLRVCRERYAPGTENETLEERTARCRRIDGVNNELDLTLAAWLHKLGHDDLAAKALGEARKDAANRTSPWKSPDPRDVLRFQLAEEHLSNFIQAYTTYRDDEAFKFGTKLFKIYPDVMRQTAEENPWHAESILADLHRRKAAGTFGGGPRRPKALPAEVPRRIAVLIDALDEVGLVALPNRLCDSGISEDWRFRGLVDIGEPAIPALIDAFERDNRRTRAWRYPTVRYVVQLIITEILSVQVGDCVTGEESLGSSPAHAAKINATAGQLRAFWNAYGKLPFDERMMKILTNPNSPDELCRIAALHLAAFQNAMGPRWLPKLFQNALLAKFARPTVAEAILAAHERALKRLTADKRTNLALGETRANVYLNALLRLDDRRIAPAVTKLALMEPDPGLRLVLTEISLYFGEAKPLEELAKSLEHGTLKLRKPAKSGTRLKEEPGDEIEQFGSIIWSLAHAKIPAADRALFALVDPKHPYHTLACDVLVRTSGYMWGSHPSWLSLARHLLDDTTETGRVYRTGSSPRGYQPNQIPLPLPPPPVPPPPVPLPPSAAGEPSDPNMCRVEAAERVCDRVASDITEGIYGLPSYHSLLLDRDEALKNVKELVNRYEGRFRPMRDTEIRNLGYGTNRRQFIPDIRPLNRAATVTDVFAGDAIFHLDGKGMPAKVKLPTWVILKDGSSGFAVQAEIGPDGEIVYGVIFTNDMRPVPATEVERIELPGKKPVSPEVRE